MAEGFGAVAELAERILRAFLGPVVGDFFPGDFDLVPDAFFEGLVDFLLEGDLPFRERVGDLLVGSTGFFGNLAAR